MKKNKSQNAVDIQSLRNFLYSNAERGELVELTQILKCRVEDDKKLLVWNVVQALYARFQTPLGYITRDPTLDQMCDKAAKRLKTGKLEGEGWKKLHHFSVKVFEKILKSMPQEEKEKLLTEMWNKLDDEQKKEMKDKFNVANMNSFIHSSEVMVAHTLGLHLAREVAIYTAATIIRLNLGVGITLAASTALSRGIAVFLGPVGWALLALSVNDFMGANYKRVIPALLTMNIINMRAHPSCISFNPMP
ncbi:MAG: hypothetical protein HQM16_10200 [Deltaproteobacteria bacterium]|nr:hypothetical protein [Deltaproteobacteria bacterium]